MIVLAGLRSRCFRVLSAFAGRALVLSMLLANCFPSVCTSQTRTTSSASRLRLAATRLPDHWELVSASISQTSFESTGILALRHSAPADTQVLRLRAEYFDQQDRLCFALVFIVNAANQPYDEIQTVRATSPGMAAAAEPVAIRVTEVVGAPGEPLIISTPATVLAYSRPDGEYVDYQVKPKTTTGKDSIDLVLAEVSVSTSGHVQSLFLLGVRDQSLRDWAVNFVRRLRFAPALEQGRAVPSRTLLLLRLLPKGSTRPQLASKVPWLMDTVAIRHSAVLPFVNILRFEPPSNWSDTVSASEVNRKWMFVSLGTDWSVEAFEWGADPRTKKTGRVWRSGNNEPQLLER